MRLSLAPRLQASYDERLVKWLLWLLLAVLLIAIVLPLSAMLGQALARR